MTCSFKNWGFSRYFFLQLLSLYSNCCRNVLRWIYSKKYLKISTKYFSIHYFSNVLVPKPTFLSVSLPITQWQPISNLQSTLSVSPLQLHPWLSVLKTTSQLKVWFKSTDVGKLIRSLEWFSNKIPAFEWSFSRTLSKTRKVHKFVRFSFYIGGFDLYLSGVF